MHTVLSNKVFFFERLICGSDLFYKLIKSNKVIFDYVYYGSKLGNMITIFACQLYVTGYLFV